MENVFRHQTSTSIEHDLVPFLSSCLETSGWALVKIEPSKQIETDMLAIAVLCGHRFSRSLGYYILESEGSPNHLEAHSEGISNAKGITPLFCARLYPAK